MNKLLLVFLLLVLSWRQDPDLADETAARESTGKISEEDMEIIKIMDILNDMDLLENIDLLKDFDLLKEDNHHEKDN